MIYLYKMAIRDLGRNRRRSFFSALALGIGLALLLLMAAVLAGEMRYSMDNTIKLQSGHLQVRAASYSEDKTSLAWEDLIDNPAALAEKIAALPPVKVVTPRLFASGIITITDQSKGVSILGVDPDSPANQPFRDGLLDGQFLTADDREGLLVGNTLADKLGLKVGQDLRLLVNTSDGSVDEQSFVVRGIYTTRTPAYDQTTVILPLAKAQAITRTEGHASALFILLDNRDNAESVAAALQSNQYKVRTWQQANELILQLETFSRAYMMVLYLIVLAITATVIVNTLVMAVFERTREIGILSAIGMKPLRIMAMFFAESSILAVGGIVLGLAMGSLLVWYASTVGFYVGNYGATGFLLGERIYGYLTASDAVSLVITAFVVTLLAALYPAFLAARMEPVEALHAAK